MTTTKRQTRIIWHCIHATNKLSANHDTAIIVWTPDSDVVPLLVRFHDKIVPRLYMQTSLHCIDINSIVSSLGSKAKALSSLHSLSGCDTTGKFITKGKSKWLAVLGVCDDDMVNALLSLESDNPLSQIAMLEKIVCRLYCPKVSHIKTLRDARYYLYCADTAQCERLPPTSGAFKQAVLRAACQARMWALSDRNERVLPDPEKYGWTLVDRYFVPVTSEEQIAPDTILNLIKYACLKLECRSRHCKCFKANLPCTDLCRCLDKCENSDMATFVVDNNLEVDDLLDSIRL